MSEKEIVVGSDGSEQAGDALRWAATEAGLRSCGLRVIRAWREPFFGTGSTQHVITALAEREREAKTELDASVDKVLVDHPALTVHTQIIEEGPARAIVEASDGAEMVVVGARGRGGFAKLLLGSVSQRVAQRAASTAVIVRDLPPPGSDIVVGVDGAPGSRAALVWAHETARLHGVRLRPVLVWHFLLQQGVDGPQPFRPDYSEADARQALDAIVSGTLGDGSGVEIAPTLVCDLPTNALVEQAANAGLMVVAARRHSRFRGDLGGVARQVVHYAPTSVAVVRTPEIGGGE
jgi:nucleotide-binding universal stress UspA family protein